MPLTRRQEQEQQQQQQPPEHDSEEDDNQSSSDVVEVEEEPELPYYGPPEGVEYSRTSDWLPKELKAEIDEWAPDEKSDLVKEERIAERAVEKLQTACQSLFPPKRHFCNYFQLYQTAKRLADLWHFTITRNGFSLSMEMDFASTSFPGGGVKDVWSINFNHVTGRNALEWIPSAVDPNKLPEQDTKFVIPIKVTAVNVYDPPRPVSPVVKHEGEDEGQQGENDDDEEEEDQQSPPSTPKRGTPQRQSGTPQKSTTPKNAKNNNKSPMMMMSPNTNPTYPELLFNKKFSDIRFLCRDGKKIPAHCMILAGASTKMERILQSKDRGTVWKVPYGSNVVRTILQHVYCDNVTQDDYQLHAEPLSFLSFSCKYNMANLKQLAIHATLQSLHSSNIADILKMTCLYGEELDKIRDACFEYAKQYPFDVLSDPALVHLGDSVPELWTDLIGCIHGAGTPREEAREKEQQQSSSLSSPSPSKSKRPRVA